MDRILQNTASTIYGTFSQDGVLVDPSPATATVTITRADGTAVVTDATTTHTATGTFAFVLTTTYTALLDTLTVQWTSSLGTITTTVETVGGFLFTIAEARATSGLNAQNNDLTYKIATADIEAMRTKVEQTLEDACGVAFVLRYSLETLSVSGGQIITRPLPRIIRSLTSGTAALTVDQLAALTINPFGVISGSMLGSGTVNGETTGLADGPVRVGYEHGYDTPPGRVGRAALALTKRWLTGAAADDRATTMTTDEQTTTFYVPRSTELFDVPECNAVVRQYGMSRSVV